MIPDDTFFEHVLLEAWQDHADSAHDIGHIRRVVGTAKAIAITEGAKLEVVIPAAWLHDIVNLPKNHPSRALASSLAADKAREILAENRYPAEYLGGIHHAICAHSFSAGITPETLEAKVLQDADRLDALGAIGIARCFAVSGALGRALFDPDDPLADNRPPDDTVYGLDHFRTKLYKIAETLHTRTARDIAAERVSFMRIFEAKIAYENGQ